ncbi:MAG: DUF6702 family protein [Bacteroidota bacterium]
MLKTWLSLLFLLPFLPNHDFHISKTTIRYVAEREQVQVEMHIFLDDLEIALEEAGSPKLYIGTELEMQQTGATIASYLEKHFTLTWNGQPLPVGFLGYELSDDLQALWIYLQAKTREDLQSISVQNTILTEIYDDQKNLVKVVANSKETTLLLSRDTPKEKYSF